MSRKELKDIALATYRNVGDALAGEQIIAQARDIGKTRVVSGTHTHQIQETVLRSNVLCVIDRAFKLKSGGMRLKE
jgi:hypothetical protein